MMKYSEKLIDDVRDYLMDASIDETRDYLCDLGYDWCYVYDLDDLYNDYCNGQLDEVINMFVSVRMDAYDGGEYYVSYGEVCEANELEDRIWEELEDEDLIIRLIDYALSGKINASSSLLEIINSRNVTWDDVDDAVLCNFRKFCECERGALKDPEYADEPFTFAEVCGKIANVERIVNHIRSTKFGHIDESKYEKIIDALHINEQWLEQATGVAVAHMAYGISLEKGFEVYLKKAWFEEDK